MAARKRAQERDFNRRRWMVLDKGIDMAYNQKDTALGECLLKWNAREETQLQRQQKLLQRQGDIVVGYCEQEKNLFVVTRDQAIREPTLLLERMPSAQQYPDYVDVNQPRYMRPLNSRQSKTPEFSTFSVFQAVKKRKRNPWEDAVKEAVQFRPTLCPCARLNRQDTEKLLMDWVVVNEKQTKALGMRSDNRSAPVKQVRTGLNPLNLPSRLNSRMHHLARDLLDDLSATSSDATSDSCSRETVDPAIEPSDDADDEAEPPVFVTQQVPQKSVEQLPRSGPPVMQLRQRPELQLQQPHNQEFMLFEARDNSQKEKKLSQKRAVDGALASLYEMLERRRATGRPRVRHGGSRSRAAPSTAPSSTPASAASTALGIGPLSRVSTAASSAAREVTRVPLFAQQQPLAPPQHQQYPVHTTCRSAKSIQILLDSRRRRQPLPHQPACHPQASAEDPQL